MDLQQRLHGNLGFFAERSHVRIVQIRFVEEEPARRACACAGAGTQRRAGGYSMPLRRIWLAAISMTLMMKAMAKAQMRLFRTQVCRFCFWECTGGGGGGERRETTVRGGRLHLFLHKPESSPQDADWSGQVHKHFWAHSEHRGFWQMV